MQKYLSKSFLLLLLLLELLRSFFRFRSHFHRCLEVERLIEIEEHVLRILIWHVRFRWHAYDQVAALEFKCVEQSSR